MSQRILVAGGAGFLGSYVVRDLLGRGYRVRVADNLSAPASRNSWGVDVEFIQTDLRDRPAALVALEDVDVCIIAAARSGGIGFFNRLPGEILDDNVRILSATFEAARAHHIRRVVYISSSCVFDKSLDSVAKEDSIASVAPPPSGYPFSKLVGEYYCRAYAQQYMLPYTIVRPFNLYGPGEASGREPGDSHVIPDLTARALMRQTPLEIYGGGQQTRSFTHVKDVARGIALAMESSTAENEDFNLGCPSEITILELAKLLWELCDVGQPFAYCTLQAFPNDIQRRAVDITKAKTLLGWEPQINLRRGLREFVEWMRAQSVARHALRT